ncbi:MAG: hemerythrin domain-containing protein [Bacteroidetes bacterium]|nr:hemerythrin domain-containing protein [Bacteroidota bacterium]
MKFMEMTPTDMVHVEQIDNQHINLAEELNLIYDSVMACDKNKTLQLLNKLNVHLKEHFITEETMMKESSFPGYISHKLEHDRFHNQMIKTTEKYGKDKEVFGLEQLKRIKVWFFNHIEINDKKCGEYFVKGRTT